MERIDLAALSRNIEAAQAQLADTVAELRHESQPGVIASHATEKAKARLRSLVFDESGAVRLEAIVASAVVIVGVGTAIVLRVRRH